MSHESRRLELQHGARTQGRRAAALAPDIAVISECAQPERLRLRSTASWMQGEPVWIGRNPHKGLAVFAFNGYAVRLAPAYHPSLRYIVRILEESFGLVSAYHAIRGEAHGQESEPTLYWLDRTRDGPTYHIDYVFLPTGWIGKVRHLSIGTFETWCGAGLSDHVPVVVDIDV